MGLLVRFQVTLFSDGIHISRIIFRSMRVGFRSNQFLFRLSSSTLSFGLINIAKKNNFVGNICVNFTAVWVNLSFQSTLD